MNRLLPCRRHPPRTNVSVLLPVVAVCLLAGGLADRIGAARPSIPHQVADAPPAGRTAPPAATPVAITAQQWLERVRSAYQGCRTYSDSGTLVRTYAGRAGHAPHGKTVTFETAFERPGSLRFAAAYAIEGQFAPGGTILRLVDGQSEVWNRSPFGEGTTQPRSLPMAIIAAVANSSSAVIQVVPLLFWPTLSGEVRDTLDLTNATLLPSAAIGDLTCVRVQGEIRPSGTCTLWIDPRTSLLRRIEQTLTGYLEGTTLVDIAPSVDTFPGFGAFELGGLPPLGETLTQRAAVSAPPAPSAPSKDAGSDPRAREILDRVWPAYARCKTYRDTGEVHYASDTLAGRLDVRATFSTAFVRPDRWRFEITEQTTGAADFGFTSVFGADGATGAAQFAGQSAAASARGVQVKTASEAYRTGSLYSHGVLTQVLPLLMPDALCDLRAMNGGQCLRWIAGARRLDDASHDGAICARVSGTLGDAEVVLWIDPATSLIRGLELSPLHHADGRAGVGPSTVSIVFRPELDATIPEQDVQVPPGK